MNTDINDQDDKISCHVGEKLFADDCPNDTQDDIELKKALRIKFPDFPIITEYEMACHERFIEAKKALQKKGNHV